MSAEGVDQNIDLALKSFIVKPTCKSLLFISSGPPTHKGLQLLMLWSVHIPCGSSLSSIQSMSLFPCLAVSLLHTMLIWFLEWESRKS